MRAALPAVLLITALGLFQPAQLRVSSRRMLFYALFGLFGIAFFYILNTEAVFLTNVATASVLLYTAPVFVTLFAAWRWNEPVTTRKFSALALAFIGCALVARAYDLAQLQLNLVGVLVAAASGFAYALYTLFSKASSHTPPPLERAASAWTTVTYSLVFGALFLLPLQFVQIAGLGGDGLEPLLANRGAWIYVAGLCLGPTLGSYALYTAALQRVPASNASVVATIEPVVAGIAGFVVFGQSLEPLQLLGAALIIGASVSLSL